MKKVFYILALALLGVMACSRETLELKKPTPEESGLVAVTMKLRVPEVQLQAQTKALGDRGTDPSIKSIRVAVFGTSGYPQAYALAEPVNKTTVDGETVYTDGEHASTNEDVYYFKVLLPVYEGEAHVHIIANGDDSIQFVDQNEASIMAQMTSANNIGAYWARVVMHDGILTQLNTDGIMQTDDEGNYIPSAETADLFKDLVLVRNFAEITLQIDEGAGITDVYWALVNDPANGSVAPVSHVYTDEDGTMQADYVDDYKDYIYNPASGKMVLADVDDDGNITTIHETYNGYMVSSDLNSAVPKAAEITTPYTTALYSYERLDPNKTNPTYLMLKAKFGTGDFTYYRVDLMDENLGGYFPLYRNYRYQIKIHRVGNRGADSPEEAALRNSGGNMSLSAETQTLTDVSDGTSRLYVEFVEKTYTTPGTKSFWAYYIPDVVNARNTINNDLIEVSVKEAGTALANTTITLDESRSSKTGMNFYTFTVKDQSSVDLSSVLQVKASNGKTDDDKSTLYRDITIKVMKTMDMDLSLDPKKVDEGTGKKTVLHIALKDTLQQSMFPLEFYIEDTNQTLNPTGKDVEGGKDIAVPVQTGPSIYDESNQHSYYFIRTVNWDEYEPMRDAWVAAKKAGTSTDGIIDFKTQFQTVKAASQTTVYVDNEYFNIKSVSLLNDGVYVYPTSSTVAHDVTSVTIDVETSETTTTWTVEAGDGVTLDKTGGTGKGTFTMTFAVNDSFTTDKTYTATVTGGGKEYPVTITQKAHVFSITPETQNVVYNATTATVTVKADDDVSWTASATGGASLSEASGTGTKVLTVTLPGNAGGTDVRTYTVTATTSDETVSHSAQIVQNIPPQSPYTFSAGDFDISDRTGTVYSAGNYLSATVTNAASGGTAANPYLTMGYQGRTTHNGELTVTPVQGATITRIIITYYNATYATYDSATNGGRTVSTGSYSVSGDTGTWTGSATGDVTFTFGYAGNNNNRNFPRITNIEVTYSVE